MIFYQYNKPNNKTYIFYIKINISKRKFLRAIKLKQGNFAGNLFAKIYDCFMSEMIDLHEEYKQYHNLEYLTFSQFLQKKYNLPDDIAKKGAERISKNTSLCLRKEYSTGDYNLEMFSLSPGEAFNTLKDVLGAADENQI